MKKSHLDNNFYTKFFLAVSIFLIIYYFFNYNIKNFFINNYVNIYTKINLFKTENTNQLKALDFEKQKLENRVFELEQYIKNASDTASILNMGQIEVVAASKISNNFLSKNIIYSDLILNKGLVEYVKNDDMVFVSGFKPVGFISETYNSSSKVTLFTQDKLETKAVIKIGQDYISLKLIGDGTFGFTANVPDSINLEIGQAVYTNNSDNFSLGNIIDIKNEDSTKEKILYINSNYSNHEGSAFYVQI